MNPIKYPTTADRAILNITSFGKIQPQWINLVNTSKEEILRVTALSPVISIYLRGSVAVGNAISDISDLDLTVIVPNGYNGMSWRDKLVTNLAQDFNFVKEVEISIYDIDRINFENPTRFKPSIAFSLKTQSLLLWGEDLIRQIPTCYADKETATKIFSEKSLVILSRLENDTNLYWCKRQLMRLGSYISMLRRDYYTRDIWLVAEDLCDIFLTKRDLIIALRDDIVNGSEDVSRSELIDLLGIFRKHISNT